MSRALPTPDDTAPQTAWSVYARRLTACGARRQQKADAALARGDLETAARHQERAAVTAHYLGLLELRDGTGRQRP
jgi:hypothetical protein